MLRPLTNLRTLLHLHLAATPLQPVPPLPGLYHHQHGTLTLLPRVPAALQPRRPFHPSPAAAKKQMPPRPKHPPESEIEETFVKGTGPGGQKINKTNSAVQLKHLPTNIVVKCQATRSRFQNRKIARDLLALKLEELEKGPQSRAAVVAETKRKRAASKAKKSRRKYRALEEGEEEEEEEGEEEEHAVVGVSKGVKGLDPIALAAMTGMSNIVVPNVNINAAVAGKGLGVGGGAVGEAAVNAEEEEDDGEEEDEDGFDEVKETDGDEEADPGPTSGTERKGR
ncbi:hypothetical protein VTJ49DRAFT_4170 [Mycothermus thermophilus]|uniref:Prokaryotic-type class I peptide chain release factors domain-containing protein n=1 Tax=Humicola insolens TaxID=85995 RepID=A0ABR3V7Z2_HUMIN